MKNYNVLVHKLLLLVFMLSMMGVASAQIAGGTYSVGSGGDYETLADVITDLNANGISGNVTMEFLDGHIEDGYNTIGPYTGNFDYELVIRPAAGASSVEIINSANGKILDFIGARNVILDGRPGGVGSSVLTLTNNSTSGALAGISFEGQTRDVTVRHCNIIYRGFGIRTIGGGINDPENVIIENCTFSTPTINETLPNLWAVNHNSNRASSMTIRNNVFESPNVGTGNIGTYVAIYFRSGIDVYNNIISVEGDIRTENIYGIRSFSGTGATKNFEHNTIAFIGGSSTNSAVDVFPINFYHSGTANFSNNIIYNGYDGGAGCTRGIIKEQTNLGGIFNATDNIWGMSFSATAQDRFYLIDLAPGDINTSYPGNTAAAQQNFNFVDFANNDLSLTESSLLTERRFRTLNPTQTTDIYGNPRDANLATKGAIESPFSASDNNLYDVTAPEFSGVSITKFSTFGRFVVSVENPTPNLTFSPVFTLAPGATVSPESGQPYDFSQTINFSRSFDVTAANGTDVFSWGVNIEGENRWPAGTYSVGSGLDFESVREAANSFAIFGIEGDVILELEDGYSGAWGSFLFGPGLDDYTITIRPEAGATDITAPFSSTGGKNIILDGRPGGVGESVLSFRALSYSASGTQGAVRHVSFSNQIGNGQVYGLRVFGGNADVIIENCSFTRPAALGSPTGGKFSVVLIQTGNNLTIRNNKIYDFKYTPTSSGAEFNGIEIVGDIAGKTAIYNNSISIRPEKFGPITGIQIESATTGEVDIFHNTINIEDSGTGDQTGTYTGISVLANPSILNIQNNIVSNTSPGTRRGILYATASGEKNVDYNNVSGTLPFTYTLPYTDATGFKSAFINSSTVDATFTDASTGDLSLSSSLNNNSQIRTVLDAGVPNDINGTARGSFPMKGAYDAPGSGFNDILSLSFTGSSGLAIDSDNATVSVDADPALDRSNLPVNITIPPGASISPDPSVGQNYTNPVMFTVTSENDIDKVWTITVGEAQVAPTDIDLSSNTVNENNAFNTAIGTLSTVDGNAGDSHMYTLVSGTGSNNNNQFRIIGDELQTNAVLNFESGQTKTIRVQTDDGNGGLFEKILTVAVQNVNEAPTNVDVSENEFDENLTATDITFIDVSDPDANDTHTFTFVSGDGDVDNDKFEIGFNAIEGHFLTRLVDFDFESQNSFSIRLRATDADGLFVESEIPIQISDIQEAPTDILLTPAAINENNAIDDPVGTLSSEDDDTADTHTYTFATGDGDTDNASFTIDAGTGELIAKEVFDHETKDSYTVRIQTEDNNGGLFERALSISINDVNEAPSDLDLVGRNIDENMPIGTLIGILSTTDEDEGDTHSYSYTNGCSDCDPIGDEATPFIIVGNELRSNIVFDFETTSFYGIDVTSTDADGLTRTEGKIIQINDLPAQVTSLDLSNQSINENQNAGALVGVLSTSGTELSGNFTYTLVAGAGDADNALFDIVDNELQSASMFDFETTNTYSVRVRTDDGNGGVMEEMFTINVTDVNEAPTDVDITNKTVDESTPIGTVVGILSTDDVDAGDTHTYTVADGCSACDPLSTSSNFTIVGNELRTAVVFDFETEDTYGIDVTSTDAGGLTRTDSFIIRINDLPAFITSLSLSGQSIDENQNTGSTIGTFSTTGEDLSGNYTYTLVSGMGDNDNASFSVSGDQLLTSASFDFETKSSYSIRVMTDDGSLTREESFTISVNNVSEAPTDLSLSAVSIAENNAVNAVIGSMTTTDEDAGEMYTYSLVAGSGDTDNASFNINGSELRATDVFDFETKNSYSVRIETNDGNGGTYQEAFTISITNQNESISVTNPIADQSQEEGFATLDIDLTNVFTDTDGDALTYMVSSSNTAAVTVANTGATLTITEVGIGTATITVTADDGSGQSTSDEFSFTVTEDPNNAPTVANPIADVSEREGFASVDIDLTNVFSDADSDPLTYEVSSSNVSVVTVTNTGTTLTISEVGIGTATISVTASDGSGMTATDEFDFTVEPPVGFEDEISLEVYPNPTTSILNIKSNEVLNIDLTDFNGRRLKSGEGRELQMDLRDLSSGVYLLKITNKQSTVTRRIKKAN